MKETTPKGVVFLRFRGIVKRDTTCSGSGHRFESYIVHHRQSPKGGCLFLFTTMNEYTKMGKHPRMRADMPPPGVLLSKGEWGAGWGENDWTVFSVGGHCLFSSC